MKAILFKELYETMHSNQDFFLLAALSQQPELEIIATAFKERFIDISTCQHSALNIAIDLINKGFLVILCVQTPQFIMRWYEDLLKTLSFKRSSLIIIGITSNILPEFCQRIQLGPEIMLAYTIPWLTIVIPATRLEVGTLIAQACRIKNPTYIHIERNHETEIATSAALPQLFEPIEYSHGTQAICIGIGSALDKAYQTKILLENYGYSASLVSMHTIKPLNHIFLRKILHAYSAIFIFEDQDTLLGIGKLIGCFVAENKTRSILFKSFGSNTQTENKLTSKKFNMQAAGLEILELLINSGIIPDHETWNTKK